MRKVNFVIIIAIAFIIAISILFCQIIKAERAYLVTISTTGNTMPLSILVVPRGIRP